MEHKKIKMFLVIYYLVVLIISLLSFVAFLRDPVGFERATSMLNTRMEQFLIIIPIIIFLLAIMSIVIIIKNKLQSLFLVHPIYYCCFFIVWLNLIPIFVSIQYPTNVSPTILDNISRLDIFFYLFDIIISGFILYKIIKKKMI